MKKVFGTKEWAKYSANVTIGCANDCKYCYARSNYYKNNDEDWTNERTDENKLNFKWDKKDGTIMFPTQHDITENNIDDCLVVLKNILSVGNNVLIVSKPSYNVIVKLLEELLEYKEQILIRFTIGSKNNNVLNIWEKKASPYEERLRSLRFAYYLGYSTSVSMEPFLDTSVEEVIDTALSFIPFVTNSIWLGKMNSIDKRVTEISEEVIEKYKNFSTDENILKIYNKLKDNEKIKWKESIKNIVGINTPEDIGLDI